MTSVRPLSAKPVRLSARPIRALLALMLVASPLWAQQQQGAARLSSQREILAKETYEVPPPELVKLATAPWHLNTLLANPSPDRKYFLKEETESMQSMADYSRPHLWLGGLQVDAKANRARALSTRGAAGIQIIEATTGKVSRIDAPKGSKISSSRWSPDGSQVAFIANFDAVSHVFVADMVAGKATQLTTTPLLATAMPTIDWTPDGKAIVAVLIPDNRKPEPKAPEVSTGPKVQLTEGVKTNERYHFSLLEDPFQAEQLEYFTTGQLAVVDAKSKTVKKIGAPAMIRRADASPDGQYFRVTTVTKPFSYIVPFTSFGTLEQLWNASGQVVAEIDRRAVQLESDTAGASTRATAPGRKRALAWMPQGAGLSFIEAKPGARGADTANAAGGGRGGATTRIDRVSQWLPPFGANDTKVLYENDGPISDAVFSEDARMLFIGSSSSGTGEIFAVDLGSPSAKRVIVRMRGYTPAFLGAAPSFGGGGAGTAGDSAAFYANPGGLVTRRGKNGGQVAMMASDGSVFLKGTRYFPSLVQDPPRDFVDKVNVMSGAKTRVFEGPRETYDAVTTPLDDDYTQFIVNRESPREVPNSFLKDTRSGSLTKLTSNKDYAPEFTSSIRKRLMATRADGIRFIVDLTLPANYQPGTRLPAMFWFYPGEYTDQAGYDRRFRTDNVNRFPSTGVRQIQYFVIQGYAVAEFNPPIVGDAGRMNDNYVSDLRMNLAAVIDELDKGGYIDRSRLGIGGHSYGAFSTANALVNTPFFKAGIAGDGMYNRTLTPTGFQSERRPFWTASKTYLEMSPMLSVDKLQGALLLYHGIEDTNFGTHPISSIRMMQALRATGKTASLYMYPFEDHGPATKETDLDLWARWSAWLDIYVKHAGEKPAAVIP